MVGARAERGRNAQSGSPAFRGGPGKSRLALEVALSAAAIGVIYGYDTGVVAGALLFIPREMGLSTAETSSIATTLALGMIIGALAGGRLADRFGRRITMVGVGVGYVVFALLSAVAQGIVFLDIARFLVGLTVGVTLVTAPVFIAESSPARTRGSLLVAYQVATVAGIMCSYLVDYWLAPWSAWRWMFGVSAIPAALVTLVLLRLPDTPRWYAMKGRREEAAAVLARIEPEADADAELAAIQEALQEERGGSVPQLLRPPYRRAALFVIGLGLLIQLTGINAIVYYTPLIFKELGLTGNAALLLVPALVQFVGLLATVAALRIVDRVGRRKVLLAGIATMVVANLLMIAVFAIGLGGGVSGLAFAGILLFIAGFDFGFGALVWVYASESFPAPLRATGSSVMLTADLVGNLIIAQFFLSVLAQIGGVWTFAIFGVLAVVSFFYVLALAPETRGRPLEDIRLYWENGGRWPSVDGVSQGR
jgi:MFS transporter, SP family, galactose:H+ symporter